VCALVESRGRLRGCAMRSKRWAFAGGPVAGGVTRFSALEALLQRRWIVFVVAAAELEDLAARGFAAFPQDGYVVRRCGFELVAVAGGVGFGLLVFQLPAVAPARWEGVGAAEEDGAEYAANGAAQVRLP